MTDPTVDPDRWERIQQILNAALEREAGTRHAFLEEACGDDHALRAQVDSLLLAHETAAPTPSEDQRLGDQLDLLRDALEERYDVKREIGSGGMATVYLAHDRKHNREVALKVLRPALAATIGGERFLREIEIAAGLQHPHILPLYDSGIAGTMLYYVMPYVEGDTLLRLVSRGTLSTRNAIQVALDVLSALAYAHRRGVVHRDIKPANILMSASGGHAVVADFGIARAVSAAGPGGLTVPGAMIGTPGYMAPEQAAGREITPATDVYAVGVVLYECLTSRHWPMTERLQDVDWSGVPARVLPILKRALSWAPEDRWSDASAFRDALHSAGRASMRLTSSSLGTERWSSGRRRTMVAVLGVAALALGVAITSQLLRPDGAVPAATATRVAVLPFTVRGASEFAYLGEGVVDLLSTKLDGAGTWRSIDPRAVLGVVQREGSGTVIDPTTGRRIAERIGANLYVLGDVVQVGAQLSLDASLYDVEDHSTSLIQASVEGGVDEVLDLMDRMAAQLIAAQPEMAEARLSQIALVTSSSLPAVKAYLRGVSHLRNAQYPEAANAFESAIAADSTFALAWYQLGIAADWLLFTDLARESTRQALRYAGRLSERDRRLLAARGAAVVDADAVEAERRYRAIVGTYPTDVEAWSQLGEVLLHWGPRSGQPIEAAREPWKRLLELEPNRPNALIHLARIETVAGNRAALDSIVRRVVELAPEGGRGLEMRLLQAYVRDDVAAQERVLADFRQASDDAVAQGAWSAGSFLDNPTAAAALGSILTQNTRSADARVAGYGILASARMVEGRWNSAIATLEDMAAVNSVAALEQRTMLAATAVTAVDSGALDGYREQLRAVDWTAIPPAAAPGVWATALDGLHAHVGQYLIGLASARLGDRSQALEAAEALEAMGTPEGYGSLVRDWARGIRSTTAWRSGDVDDALREIDQFEGRVWYQFATASTFLTLAYERYLRARLLEEAGRLREALRWYGSFEAIGLHDSIFLAPAHWHRGHIHRRLGDEETARIHFERFLGLWRDADAAFRPMVEDARQQLNGG